MSIVQDADSEATVRAGLRCQGLGREVAGTMVLCERNRTNRPSGLLPGPGVRIRGSWVRGVGQWAYGLVGRQGSEIVVPGAGQRRSPTSENKLGMWDVM